MVKELFPEADIDFAEGATMFALTIARDPERYFLSDEDARRITRAAKCFDDAFRKSHAKATRTTIAVKEKDRLRREAEQVMRKYANLIRPNEDISAVDKLCVRIYERPAKLRARKCPRKAPVLDYLRAIEPSGCGPGRHVLRFRDGAAQPLLSLVDGSGTRGQPKRAKPKRAKPAGAARIELFVEFFADGERVPKHPGELGWGCPVYLRSFTRNPIEVEFPVPTSPMLAVYWARWADAKGKFGPWSNACRARVEGGFASAGALPDQRTAPRRRTKCVVTLIERPQRYLEQDDADALLLEDATVSVEPKQLPEAA